jgi:hypothetical protein
MIPAVTSCGYQSLARAVALVELETSASIGVMGYLFEAVDLASSKLDSASRGSNMCFHPAIWLGTSYIVFECFAGVRTRQTAFREA